MIRASFALGGNSIDVIDAQLAEVLKKYGVHAGADG